MTQPTTTVTMTAHARNTALGGAMVSLGLLAAAAPALVKMGPVGVIGVFGLMAGGVELLFSMRRGPVGETPLRFAFSGATLLGAVLLIGGATHLMANPVALLASVLAGGALIDAWLAGSHHAAAGTRWLTANAIVALLSAALLAWMPAGAGLTPAAVAIGARLLARGLAMEGMGEVAR